MRRRQSRRKTRRRITCRVNRLEILICAKINCVFFRPNYGIYSRVCPRDSVRVRGTRLHGSVPSGLLDPFPDLGSIELVEQDPCQMAYCDARIRPGKKLKTYKFVQVFYESPLFSGGARSYGESVQEHVDKCAEQAEGLTAVPLGIG